MSETVITETENETANEAPKTDEPQGSEEKETDWKEQARKWEARAKAAKSDTEDAKRWREYEASQKTEHEKQAERLAQLEAEAASATLKLTRYEVAAAKAVPSEAIDLLTGSTREELEASADKLNSLIANQSKTNTPKPDANQGKATRNGATTADQFASAISDLL